MKRTPVVLLALALALSLGLGACGGGGGNSVASFCSLVKTDNAKFQASSDSSNDAQKSLQILAGIEGKAPSAIKADIKLVADDAAKILKDPAAAASLDQTAFTSAGNRVTAYVKDKCHVDIS